MGPGEPPAPSRRARLNEDRRSIYLAKGIRAVAYGALSGFLFLYLTEDLGFSVLVGTILTALSLIGAAFWNLLVLPPVENAWGRRRALSFFSALFTASAVILFLDSNPFVVVAAVLLGGVAASSADNGPLASLDQAIIPSTLRRSERADAFAWYNLIANFAGAGGALLLAVPGAFASHTIPYLPSAPHPWILLVYVVLAATTWASYAGLSSSVELEPEMARKPAPSLSAKTRFHLRDLTVLFSIDSFAGGLLINPLIAAYFVLAWHQGAQGIGVILFLIGTVSGLSFLVASRLADRIGLLRTMVFTHLPSNVLLVLVPLMPTLGLALGLLAARFALSQMDVPTRQAYVMNLVERRERTRVAGTLSGARSVAQSVGPFPSAGLQAVGYLAAPFYLCGAFKIVYDLMLWRRFKQVEIPAEQERPGEGAEREPSPVSSPPRG